MSRLVLRTTQHAADIAILAMVFMASFLLRFDGDLPAAMVKRMFFLTPYVVGLKFMSLYWARVPRFAWRYVGLPEAGRIGMAMLVSSMVLLVARVVSGALVADMPWVQYALVPFGIIAIDLALSFLAITGVRVAWRLRIEHRNRLRRVRRAGPEKRTLLVGAGRAGVTVARELSMHPDLGLRPVGFVDDDPSKQGRELHGVRVLGTTDDMARQVRDLGVEQVVITIASASGAEIRRIVRQAEEAGLPAKIIPGIHEILDGKVRLDRIRPVSIEDLLGREAVDLDLDLVRAFVADRHVVVTGAGGSIGSELCRQVARLSPARLVMVERAEPALFEITQELRAGHPDVEIVPALGDVGDGERMEHVFRRHGPHVVFHAAAHKHVPLVEDNPGEAIKNNVFGTRTVAEVADRSGVETFVLVSTDKAVNPTSVMGASKRVAEVVLQSLSRRSRTRFVAVRFGNVLGSAGSVIPIFKRQIRRGGPVTVTHPDMKRYFMTIPEASQLVVQAGAMGQGGEIFVLDMGEPVKIVDLARDLIRLSGFEPDADIPVVFTGVRPGEKLFEELGFDAERMDKTRHRKIYIGKLASVDWADVERGLEALRGCVGAASRDEALQALRILVPEFQDDARARDSAPKPTVERKTPRLVPPQPALAD
ncbi:MAG: polysaccharide biosynthesis protein [Myxococcota bacterium]